MTITSSEMFNCCKTYPRLLVAKNIALDGWDLCYALNDVTNTILVK